MPKSTREPGFTECTPAGKALFQMMGVFAEFERAMIRERVHAGLNRARSQGKRLGRPTIDADKAAAWRAVPCTSMKSDTGKPSSSGYPIKRYCSAACNCAASGRNSSTASS